MWTRERCSCFSEANLELDEASLLAKNALVEEVHNYLLDLIRIRMDRLRNILVKFKGYFHVLVFHIILCHLSQFLKELLDLNFLKPRVELVFRDVVTDLEVFDLQLDLEELEETLINGFLPLVADKLFELLDGLLGVPSVLVHLVHHVVSQLGHLFLCFHDLLIHHD